MEIKKQRVLSLCDGMSGGYLAFKELGVPVEYHAVEIDAHARKLSDHNLPDIIRWQNDVTKVTKEDIEFYGPFDWVIFGSACQSLSVSGRGEGFSGKSKILFDCVNVLQWCREGNPSLNFLSENVKMKSEFLDQYDLIINSEERILINSSLMSAQKRERYYWTNFKVAQPLSRNSFIKDIIEDGNEVFAWSKSTRYIMPDGKVSSRKQGSVKSIIEQRINSGRANTLTTGDGCSNQSTCNYVVRIVPDKAWGGGEPSNKDREYSSERENPELLASFAKSLGVSEGRIGYRKLTVRECARLQKIPEWYDFSPVSKTQGYKAIGNGWCIAVIVHILKYGLGLLKAEEKGEDLL